MAATLTRGATHSTSRLSLGSQIQCRQQELENLSTICRKKHVSSLGSLQVLAKRAALPRYQGLRNAALLSASVCQASSHGAEKARHGRKEARAAAPAVAKPVSLEPIQVSCAFCKRLCRAFRTVGQVYVSYCRMSYCRMVMVQEYGRYAFLLDISFSAWHGEFVSWLGSQEAGPSPLHHSGGLHQFGRSLILLLSLRAAVHYDVPGAIQTIPSLYQGKPIVA